MPARQPDKLSADNLSQMDAASRKSAAPSKGSKKSKSQRPAWAVTEK